MGFYLRVWRTSRIAIEKMGKEGGKKETKGKGERVEEGEGRVGGKRI